MKSATATKSTKPAAKSAAKTAPVKLAPVVTTPTSPATKPVPQPVQSSAPSATGKVATIKLLSPTNPHGADTKDFKKWQKLSDAQTVADALKAGVDRGYLNYMATKRKQIAIG